MADSTSSTEPTVPDVKWRQRFAANERMKQIVAVEKAAKSSINCLNHMKSTLAAEADPSLARICQLWQSGIDDVLCLQANHRVLVGVRGITGAGKSTMINSILRMKDLLPTNSSQACTAVPVEVAYNHTNDSKELFRAEVQFATTEQWKMELDDLFIDVKGHLVANNDIGGDEDHDRKKRIADTLSKLRYVYPYLKSIDDLGSTSPKTLLNDKEVKKILSSKKIIQSNTLVEFSAAIMIYVATQASDRKTFVHWPLVTCVKIFVKAPLLKSGLVLVDLPGGMDSNAARGAVAEKYQKNLAVTCMVVDSRRGVDDRNAHDLMEELLKRDMQMDGIYDSDHLCFVLSQCDRGYDVPNYGRQNKTLFESLKPQRDKLRELFTTLRERERQYCEAQKSYDTNSSEAKDVEDKIRELRSKYNLNMAGAKLKRKRDQNDGCKTIQQSAALAKIAELEELVSNLKIAEAAATKEQSTLTKRQNDVKKALYFAETIVVQECNNHKNKKAVSAVQRDFENTRKGMGCTSTIPLKVFCVAASTYLRYIARNGLLTLGFPSTSATEIPLLRDWLIRFTYEGREKIATSIVAGTELLITTMKPWIDDKQGNIKLSDMSRGNVESILEGKVKELDQEFSELCLEVATSISGLVHNTIYSKLPQVEKLAAIKSQATIIDLEQEKEHPRKALPWNTYRAINRRRGFWADSKRDYRWNDQLFLDYSNHLVREWNEVFYSDQGISQSISLYAEKLEQLLTNFTSAAADIEDYLNISMKLELKDQLSKAGRAMQFKTGATFDNLKLAVRESHRAVASPAISEYLSPIYTTCGAEKGPGHFKRNKEMHHTHMKENGINMHRKASFAITEALDSMLHDLPLQISGSHSEMVEQVKNVIDIFLEENTSTHSRYPERKINSRAKSNLQNSLQQDIVGLVGAWDEKVSFEPEELDDLSGFRFEQNDKYNLHEEDLHDDDIKDEDYVD